MGAGHPDGDENASAADVTRPSRCAALGRTPRRRGAQAGIESARRASCAPRARGAASVPRDAEGKSRTAFTSRGQARTRARAQLRSSSRPRALPPRALLDPTQSRARDRRSRRQACARLWDEVARRAPRAGSESSPSATRTGARRPVSPAYAADAARSQERDRIRPAEREDASRQERTQAACGALRSRIVGSMVCRLGPSGPGCAPHASTSHRRTTHLAVAHRLAAPRVDRSAGDPWEAMTRLFRWVSFTNGGPGAEPPGPLSSLLRAAQARSPADVGVRAIPVDLLAQFVREDPHARGSARRVPGALFSRHLSSTADRARGTQFGSSSSSSSIACGSSTQRR